ncbi:tudor domain-containing protein 7B isoform X2 [Melanaphis sacchari]|nr:tudor domain-containing protein 7B isoform X2 [Melanaphis sacchari]XP_025206965.1 tudor domain-containing protein 7B isoform X2 [Melanaphis sacchari]XP_025206966.1 tudor domain-containing protein 7B isoform X2 [Melanaphis sacchari]
MNDLDSVLLELNACLISTKSGIPLNQLEHEYFKLNGERIPFKQLGFPSLEALLQSSKKFNIQNYGGNAIVKAVGNSKTQHLTELIKKQKSKPPKKKPFIGSQNAPRKFGTSNTYNRPNNYSRPGNNGLNNGSSKNNYQGTSIPNYTNSYNRQQSSYSDNKHNRFNINEPKTFDHNSYKKPQFSISNYNNSTKSYSENLQLNSDICLPETKPFNNLSNDSRKNGVQSVPISNDIKSLNENTKSDHIPLTSSCSSLESTYSSSSASYKPMHTLPDKFQIGDTVNKNNEDTIPRNHIIMQENNSEFKRSVKQHKSIPKFSSLQNMPPIKISTAQSRLEKYPKKCEEQTKVDVENNSKTEKLCVAATDLRIEVEDPTLEVFEEDKDYINELETYLKNLNLSEPYYEYMVKKEKSGKLIKLIHICTIKVNEKSVGSSFPVDCSSDDYAQKVAAKRALTTLKKQYGESVIYPITNDINTVALCVKRLLKQGYETTGIMSDVLERMYREEFQENMPDNWDQLLGVFSYFIFDKLAPNKVVIYLNETESNQQNGHEYIVEEVADEQSFVPGTSLLFEDYLEKSVLVSANYGSTSIWVRLVGQSADENFIQMQAKFNDIMNTEKLSIPDQVIESEFYAVLYNSSWHRVQILSATNDDDTATCFMIDTGEQLNIAKDQICNLEPIFMKPKTQAIKCILNQLDNFGSFDGLKELLDEMILNKTFFLKPDSIGNSPRITLYEKGGINVNDMIIQRFVEKTSTKLPLFEDQAIVDGNVSSIVESGHLYLQLNFDVVSSLEEILSNDEFYDPEYFLKSKEDIVKDKVYVTKYEADNIWCRVKVVDIISDSEAKIMYIDYGNTAQCEITKIANLEFYDPLLAKIAPQAIKVSMNFIPPNTMTPDIAQKIFDIIGRDTVLVNTVNAPNDDVPCVQLYKTEPDSPNIPYCINIPLFQS